MPGAEVKPSGVEVSRADPRLLTRGDGAEPPPLPTSHHILHQGTVQAHSKGWAHPNRETTALIALGNAFQSGSRKGCSVTRSLYFLFPGFLSGPASLLSSSFLNLGMHLPLTINKEEYMETSSIKF